MTATTTHERPNDPYLQIQSKEPATRLQSEAQAIATAKHLASQFAQESIQRDRERRLPFAELDAYSQSGLWSIVVPKAYGGLGASYRTVAEVFKSISAADASLGQLPQNHFVILAHIALDGTEEQKRFFFDLALSGTRFGNAFSERGGRNVSEFQTRISPEGEGFVVEGQKFFSTGALLAHWIPIVAVNEESLPHLAIVPRATEGLTVVNDWSSFGLRTTASGTVPPAMSCRFGAPLPTRQPLDPFRNFCRRPSTPAWLAAPWKTR